MSIVESDLDLLETYLDGELPIADAEGLWRRLSSEPGLTAALGELRAQRANRSVVWQQMEPADREDASVRRHVTASVRRHNHVENIWRIGKVSSAAAAMILLGFAVGRMRAVSPAATAPASNGQFVSMTNTPDNSDDNIYRVGYFDKNGKLIAVQPFNSLQDAKEFVNDVNQPTTDNNNSPIVPISDDQWR